MKKFFVAVLAALSLQAYAQEKITLEKPHVDKRMELLSIVFRLAGRSEYSSKSFKAYTDRIEQHFEAYKNHELIQFTKAIIKERDHAYDAPMLLASLLDDSLRLMTNVSHDELWDDPRWTKKHVAKFIPLLRQFAKDSKFDDFFNANADLYAEASERAMPLYENFDLNWYRTFYGKEPSEIFSLVVGAGNGQGNYGLNVSYNNGSKKVYAVMSMSSTTSVNNENILVHEFNHSFTNDLFFKNKRAFKKSGKKLYSLVKSRMVAQAYGQWETMMYEALVRAAVIKYFKDHDAKQSTVENLIKTEKGNGFLWIEEFVAELENYDKQRDKYPTLESYMPKIIDAYAAWAEKIQLPTIDESKRPVVVSISEFKNGDTNVSADIKTITVNFSEPLWGRGHSILDGDKGEKAFPKLVGEQARYTNNNQSVVLYVSLEKDKEYQLVFVGEGYMSVEGVGIKDYEVSFKTAK